MFTLANIITGGNLLCGIMAIVLTFAGRLELAVLFIFLGAVLDFLDGFVARLLKQQGELGKQLDSLADMVTFGVAPGLIVFVLFILSGAVDTILAQGGVAENLWQRGTMGNNVSYWINVYFNDLVGNQSQLYLKHFTGWYIALPFVALFIPFMSLFRLAKFNLDTRQSENFIGLPTPANALFFCSFALLLYDGFGANDWKFTWSILLIKDQILMTLVVLFGFLLTSEIPLFSLKFKSMNWKGNELRFTFIVFSIVLLAVLQLWALPIILLTYVFTGVIKVITGGNRTLLEE
jgi:CDP-diacylglycerol--serine O-phosphatidyltransferase